MHNSSQSPFLLKGGGVILNTTSVAGVRPRPVVCDYSASKGGAILLTYGYRERLNKTVIAKSAATRQSHQIDLHFVRNDPPLNVNLFLPFTIVPKAYPRKYLLLLPQPEFVDQ